jgi:hypothetical protein
MPLADVRRLVARRLELPGEQVVGVVRERYPVLPAAVRRRVLTGLETGA